jgi:thiol:disulfide interchange protein DsbD
MPRLTSSKPGLLVSFLLIAAFRGSAAPADSFLLYEYESEHSSVRFFPDIQNGRPGITAEFIGTDDLHYYASPNTAPAPGVELKISVQAPGVVFGNPVFPTPSLFREEALNQDVEVFVGRFKIFVPAESGLETASGPLTITLSGLACTSKLCLTPFRKTFQGVLSPAADSSGLPKLEQITETQSGAPVLPTVSEESDSSLARMLTGWKEDVAGQPTNRTALFYFLLAVPAGLSINLMPCVLPILPLIILRLISHAKESPARRIQLGLAFCSGIILFFAAFALLAVLIQLTTGTVIDLNSLYRHPNAVIVLFLLLVFFALAFLDVISFTVPGSLAAHQPQMAAGFWSSLGMGFFAGLLSTPCSGALLGAVLVWAQSQPPALGSSAIILMGVGMALPYILLVSIPKLLDSLPKPGLWMDRMKKTGGFLLLILAVKFTLTALSKDRLVNVLLYGIIFAFCVWMWAQWVSFETPAGRRWAVRGAAILLAIVCGVWLLPAEPPAAISWQPYEPVKISQALEKGQIVLIKFTADWCTNCKVVERKVYQQPDIAKLLKDRNILAIKADTTQADFPASRDLKTLFGEAGNIPLTVLLNPQNRTVLKIRGIFEPDQLRQALRQIP